MASCAGISRAVVESQVRTGVGLILNECKDPELDVLENVARVAAQRSGAQDVQVSIYRSGGAHQVQIEFGAPEERERLRFSISKSDAA